jgi:hypothetical protein
MAVDRGEGVGHGTVVAVMGGGFYPCNERVG